MIQEYDEFTELFQELDNLLQFFFAREIFEELDESIEASNISENITIPLGSELQSGEVQSNNEMKRRASSDINGEKHEPTEEDGPKKVKYQKPNDDDDDDVDDDNDSTSSAIY